MGNNIESLIVKNHIKTFEEKRREIAQFHLTSDLLFSKVMEDKEACEQLINIILGMKLKVKDVRIQYNIRNITGHGVILDILAETEEGKIVNVEMQMENDDCHVKRVRYYQGSIDTKLFKKGKKYQELPDLYMIFITRTDFIKQGKAIYFVERILRGYSIEESESIQNGVHEIYVNLQGKTTDYRLQELLNYIKESTIVNAKEYFGAVASRVQYLKENPRGVNMMCEILQAKWQDGVRIGERLNEISLICKKLQKGMQAEAIADILEINVEKVEHIISIAQEIAPDYNAEEILRRLEEEN